MSEMKPLRDLVQNVSDAFNPAPTSSKPYLLYSFEAHDEGKKPITVAGSDMKSGKKIVRTGDVLFAKLNPRIPRAWLVDGGGNDATQLCSTEFVVLRPKNPKELDAEYLAWTLVAPQFLSPIQAQVSSSTKSHQRVRPDFILNQRVPARSHEEQQRVVRRIKECLSRVEEMRRLREEAAKEAEALMSAALREVWESEVIADAPQVALAELGSITTGNTPSRKVPDYFASTGTPWITPGDMNGAKEITSTREFLSPRGVAEARARVLAADSVVVCCIGATIGKVALVRERTGINQQINAITFGKRVNPDFGFWACRALYPQILSNAAQATLPILNKSRFGELTIPVPELKVQERTAAKLDKVLEASLAMKVTTEELAKEEQILRESILREAFAGNL